MFSVLHLVVSFSVLLLSMSSVLLLVVSFRFLFYSLYMIILVSVVSFSISFLFIVSDQSRSTFDGLILGFIDVRVICSTFGGLI